MLYHLRDWINLFGYQTFRAMTAFLVTFIFVLVFQPIFIRKLQARGIKGQPIRDDGPKQHEGKKGTPTMGGLVIVVGVLLSSLIFADPTNRYVILAISVMAAFAVLGFFDDWSKITRQNTKGISGKSRLMWEAVIAAVVALLLIRWGFDTRLSVPFFKDMGPELAWFFIPFVVLVVVGTANAVNLTDGLDGLAIGPVMTVGATYAVFAYLSGNYEFSKYLIIPHIRDVGEVMIILSSLVAAGLGFLWYNTFPAQVFMGDIGALALGGLLGLVAVLVKQELVLVVAGGIFVIEALSVIIQTRYYKLTGKRVFRMAPIHHHFELKGWAEPKIIVRFWIISIVLALLSLTTLKVR